MEAVLVALLAPFLKRLAEQGGEIVEAGVEKLGDAAWDLARRVWERLRPRVESKEAAREAVDDVARSPDDARARAALELQLQKLLAAAPELAADLKALLEEGEQSGIVATDGSVVIGGDVRADRGGVAGARDIHIEGGVRTGWKEQT